MFPHQTSVPLVSVLPMFCKHQTLISIKISSAETSYIKYARMPPPICQYVINLVVSLPIRRGPGVLMNVSVWEYRALNNQIYCGKIYYSNTIIINILM